MSRPDFDKLSEEFDRDFAKGVRAVKWVGALIGVLALSTTAFVAWGVWTLIEWVVSK